MIELNRVDEKPFPSDCECGDVFLAGVFCVDKRLGRERHYIDWSVIVCSETGWDDTDGNPWTAWEVEDVRYWARLPSNQDSNSTILKIPDSAFSDIFRINT